MDLIVVPVSFITTVILMPFVTSMLKNAGAVRKNYLGVAVPVSMGINFIPAIILGSSVMIFINPGLKELVLLNILGTTVMGFVGIIDDLLGNRDTLGFTGHLKSLLMGKLTTGGFKAIIGGLVSASISLYISTTLGEWIVNTLIIALFTNLLNLSDLRPGRAIKFFLLIWGLSFLPVFNGNYNFLLYPLIGSLIAYLPTDIRGRSMMGDVGSNILGIAIGLYYSLITPFAWKIAVLFILILLQFLGEKYSFSSIIGKSRVLSFIDGLGRGKVEGYNDKN
jgi:UDP-N-acetylmuramyl pentapeptide phosphotransferase/UDP-N-acetylglucosamine-1-phosphate transferase